MDIKYTRLIKSDIYLFGGMYFDIRWLVATGDLSEQGQGQEADLRTFKFL